jgi:hypothetical protein
MAAADRALTIARGHRLVHREMHMFITRPALIGSIVVASLTLAAPVFAGPPLLCFPFETGGAKTLPMKSGDWKAVDPKYDVSHLTADTLALLTPATPVVARMETIRRATIYAATHPQQASALLAALQERAAAKTATPGSAVFDFGYLVETYKQASYMFSPPMKGLGEIDGYQLVLKAVALQNDPAMEFGAAVIAQGSANAAERAELREHLDRALAGAKSDAALNASITKHFRTTGELR